MCVSNSLNCTGERPGLAVKAEAMDLMVSGSILRVEKLWLSPFARRM